MSERTLRIGLVCLVTVWACTGSWASTPATDLYLPSVGSGPGVPPSHWYTTIWAYNPGTSEAHVDLSLLLRDRDNSTPPATASITLGPGEVRRIDDAVVTLFGVEGFGAIHAVSDRPVSLDARIYSRQSGQGLRDSVGQLFSAVPAAEAIGPGEQGDLVGLINVAHGDFRYNVGFVNTTASAYWVAVAAYNEAGGGWISTTIQLRPYEQRQMSVANLFDNVIGEAENFRLRAHLASGTGSFILFGSRVANGSQDATTFHAITTAAQ